MDATLDVTLGGRTFPPIGKVGRGIRNRAEKLLRGIFRMWREENPDEAARMLAASETYVRGQSELLAKMNRELAAKEENIKKKYNLMMTANYYATTPGDPMGHAFTVWRDNHRADYDVELGLIKLLLLPPLPSLEQIDEIERAYDESTSQEVADVLDFLKEPASDKIDEQEKSEADGDSKSTTDSESTALPGETSVRKPAAGTSSRSKTSDRSGSSRSRTATPA